MDCPRCGYDQSGVVASWTDECPMAGVCSECGLEFEWGDVLNRSRVLLPWLYEHRRGYSFFYAPRTMFRAIRPWKFWAEVQLHHEPIPRRLIMYPLMLPVFFVLMSMLLGVTAHFIETMPIAARFGYQRIWPWESILSIAVHQFGFEYRSFIGLSWNEFNIKPLLAIFSCISFSIGMSLVLLIARSSRTYAKLRMVHVGRAAAYGMTLGMLLYAVHSSLWTWDQYALGSGYSSQYTTTVWRSTSPVLGASPFSTLIRTTLWDVLLNHWLVFGGVCSWMMAWWVFAIRTGFRIEAWKQVSIAGTCMGLGFVGLGLTITGAWRWMYH